MRDKEYVAELAETTLTLLNSDTRDASAQEIAEAHFPNMALGGEIPEHIRKRLGKIRTFLVANYKLPLTLVSETYFVRFRDNLPTTMVDARLCLPLGQGKGSYGLRLQSPGEDLIWQAARKLNSDQGAAKVKHSADEVIDAYNNNYLSPEDAANLLREAAARVQPDKIGRAKEILELTE